MNEGEDVELPTTGKSAVVVQPEVGQATERVHTRRVLYVVREYPNRSIIAVNLVQRQKTGQSGVDVNMGVDGAGKPG